MSELFPGQDEQISDAIGSGATDNTVGSAVPQIYPSVGTDPSNTANSKATDDTSNGLLQSAAKLGNSAVKAYNPEGGTFYNSPAHLAAQYTALGKFFQGTGAGNEYAPRINTPIKNKATQGTDPNEFYARWYEKMRQYAQAEETATKGQPQIRSR